MISVHGMHTHSKKLMSCIHHIRGPPASILATLNAGESGGFPEAGLTDSLQAAANGVASQFGIQVTGVQRFGEYSVQDDPSPSPA